MINKWPALFLAKTFLVKTPTSSEQLPVRVFGILLVIVGNAMATKWLQSSSQETLLDTTHLHSDFWNFDAVVGYHTGTQPLKILPGPFLPIG